jgi:hypothetical protein
MDARVYREDEAKRILDAFPPETLDELLELAARGKEDEQAIINHEKITLPEGWEYQAFANCIVARYQDGEQERKEFYYPEISIDFLDTDEIEVKKSIEKRLALGYCSCGKPMPFVQRLLWANDLIERKGFKEFPARLTGYAVILSLLVWAKVRPVHQWSLAFNLHPECL